MNKYWTTAKYVNEILKGRNKPYSIIKSYISSDFSDGNIDVVVDGNLFEIYQTFFSGEYFLKKRDIIKSKYYERNKLMCTPHNSEYISIHLHTNVGWHDLEFFSYEDVLLNSEITNIENCEIILCNREFESQVLLYHAIFEKFRFSDRDLKFIEEEILQEFRVSYGSMLKFKNRPLRFDDITYSQLCAIWLDYYRNKKGLKFKNLIFHLMLLIRQRF